MGGGQDGQGEGSCGFGDGVVYHRAKGDPSFCRVSYVIITFSTAWIESMPQFIIDRRQVIQTDSTQISPRNPPAPMSH